MKKNEPLPDANHMTRFYHNDYRGFAAHQFEAECRAVEAKGWRLTHVAQLGIAARPGDSPIICAIYQK